MNEARVMQINLYELNDGHNPASLILNNSLKNINVKDIFSKTRELLDISVET